MEVAMGTLVTIQVVRSGSAVEEALDRAFEWFHEVQARCTRFDPQSELMQLVARPGVPVFASAILFETVRFAVMAAEASGGAFDPTAGRRLQGANGATYRDIELDHEQHTIMLRRPSTLDLGAVAKGLAVDLAARELAPWRDFAIDAGGDLYLGGANEHGAPWRVGIRHPRCSYELIASLEASNKAVCTSGDYERLVPEAGPAEHHIVDPRTGASPYGAASVTVLAPGAMLADALATAAFVLGPDAGIALLEEMEVDGLIFTSELQRHETRGLRCVA
jgi:FAD:protein FMN transferase